MELHVIFRRNCKNDSWRLLLLLPFSGKGGLVLSHQCWVAADALTISGSARYQLLKYFFRPSASPPVPPPLLAAAWQPTPRSHRESTPPTVTLSCFVAASPPPSHPSPTPDLPTHRRIQLSTTGSPPPVVAADKMDEGDRSINTALAAQDPIVRELLQDEVEHGVLIPLKTTLELRDDYQTGRVLITRTPTKAANPVIVYV